MLFLGCSLAASPAWATWSVIAVGRTTGTVVIASATCVTQAASRDSRRKTCATQAIVVPGKGIAAAQAAVDKTRANQKLILAEMQKGPAPADILLLW